MKVLLTGAEGQLGFAIHSNRPAETEISALNHASLDICNRDAVMAAVRALQPNVIINAAAYAQVDRAETDTDLAFKINAVGPCYLAEAASEVGARVVHVSTNYVFGGYTARPWLPDDPPNPLSAYGRSKLAGERAVSIALEDRSVVVRTAWLYSSRGSNFVLRMLELMRARPHLRIVSDQTGTPTWATSLAAVIWGFAKRDDLSGTFHWTDGGTASWHEFAVAIQEDAVQRGLLERRCQVEAIPATDYPTAARRPAFSVLDTRATSSALGSKPEHWRKNLGTMLDELQKS